jgi:hypothetical protein
MVPFSKTPRFANVTSSLELNDITAITIRNMGSAEVTLTNSKGETMTIDASDDTPITIGNVGASGIDYIKISGSGIDVDVIYYA